MGVAHQDQSRHQSDRNCGGYHPSEARTPRTSQKDAVDTYDAEEENQIEHCLVTSIGADGGSAHQVSSWHPGEGIQQAGA